MANPFSIVDCAEVDFTQNDSTSLDDQTKSVTLQCDWGQRFALVQDLLGNNRIWPYFTGLGDLAPRAFSAAITGFGTPEPYIPDTGTAQVRVYRHARINVQYRMLQGPQDMMTSPYTAFSESITPTIDWLRVDHKKFIWSGASGLRNDMVERDETPAIPIQRMLFNRTYFNWTGPVPTEYLDAQVTCNSDTVFSVLLQRSFPPETIAYGAGPTNQTIDSDGLATAQLSIQFAHKAEGWNRFPRSTGNGATFFDSMHLIDASQPNSVGEEWKPFEPVPYAGLFV